MKEIHVESDAAARDSSRLRKLAARTENEGDARRIRRSRAEQFLIFFLIELRLDWRRLMAPMKNLKLLGLGLAAGRR